MATLLINNAAVVLQDRVLPDHSVLCRNGKIVRVAPAGELSENTAESIIEASGKNLVPGFIDLHFHGLHNYRTDLGPGDLAAICDLLPRYGVTAFLPGVVPRHRNNGAEFLTSLARVNSQGTRILGFHVEGPFLTRDGAMPPDKSGTTGLNRVNEISAAVKPYQAIFSVAPDYEGIGGMIPIMARNNTPVFMTHTRASVKQTQEAIDAGVRHATHFYDVFPPPVESDPGVRPCGAVETILADPRVSVDFILDGEHVDPVVVKMALACKGPDRVCLITDSNMGAGLPPARYKIPDRYEIEFAYEGGPARLTENSHKPGVLAGSGLTMDRAVRNVLSVLGADLPLAVRMASSNPARVLGLDKVKGQIEQGYDADMVLLDDSLEVTETWINGQSCFRSSR